MSRPSGRQPIVLIVHIGMEFPVHELAVKLMLYNPIGLRFSPHDIIDAMQELILILQLLTALRTHIARKLAALTVHQ